MHDSSSSPNFLIHNKNQNYKKLEMNYWQYYISCLILIFFLHLQVLGCLYAASECTAMVWWYLIKSHVQSLDTWHQSLTEHHDYNNPAAASGGDSAKTVDEWYQHCNLKDAIKITLLNYLPLPIRLRIISQKIIWRAQCNHVQNFYTYLCTAEIRIYVGSYSM